MKIIVAHPFQQHSFKTAVAVKNDGNLCKYVTTVYLKGGTLTSFLSKFLKGDNKKRVNGRKTTELEEDEVLTLCEWTNLLLLFLQRVDKSKIVYNFWYKATLKIFNQRLYKYVKSVKPDAVIVYDTVSKDFIQLAKKEKLECKIILDMSAPYANYMKSIFDRERSRGCDVDYLAQDKEDIKYFDYKCRSAYEEIVHADAFLVASDFTKKSLMWAGIHEDCIYKCVYGVYTQPPKYHNEGKCGSDVYPIRCCFLGKVSLEKGAHHLFNVIQKLARNDMVFHFYGSFDKNAHYYLENQRSCVFHGHIPHETMLEELRKSDIVIFPSLADGFGFSVTEGFLNNCIAVCSENAGVSELVANNVNGYTYAYDDEERLLEVLENLEMHKMREMQKLAPNSISKYTWEKYGYQITQAIEKIFNR